MTYEDAMESIKLKFTSGNTILVTRTNILLEEWKAIEAKLTQSEKRIKEYENRLDWCCNYGMKLTPICSVNPDCKSCSHFITSERIKELESDIVVLRSEK